MIAAGQRLDAARRVLADAFRKAGADSPATDARVLVAHVTGLSVAALLADPDRVLTATEADALDALARRRLAHEPLARLIGTREFHGLTFTLGPATLVPRPETELLVDAVLARVPADAACRILDVGTGTGAILLALLARLPAATGIGTDLAVGAAAVAKANAARLGLADRATFLVVDLAPAGAVFDVIVSNPPYIPTGDLAGLDPAVRDHDPVLALDGGADGLTVYRRIAALAPRLLTPGGLVALEVGIGQAGEVSALLEKAGFRAVEPPIPDLSGIPRVVVARFPGSF